jgi:hypothetical protein
MVSFGAVVSAPRTLMHRVRQHKQAINSIVFFKLSPQYRSDDFYPYKDSDERLECIFLSARNAEKTFLQVGILSVSPTCKIGLVPLFTDSSEYPVNFGRFVISIFETRGNQIAS